MDHTTLHLWRVGPRHVPAAVARMGLDRLRLRHAPGLRFHKLLGTGSGRTFSPRDADPLVWALLCTWTDRGAADAFEAHPTPRGWRRIAHEEWRADLGCLRTKGRWSRSSPFCVDPGLSGWEGPVASITRARLAPRHLGTFWQAVPPVVADLAHDGPLLRLGIGEAPVGVQGTFTVWRDAEALTDFAYRRTAHRTAIADTDRLGWYAEELFARFALLAQRGTVFGATLPLPPSGLGPTTGDPDA
ncbi:MAG TPA: hypothetical protein VMM13_06110 [Euzebya sp.]|nr:hypothetical protein [Euzebya sp.]